MMNEPQNTRLTLLLRLRDGADREAWADFVDLYSPVVYGFARRQGLQDADAADLVQEVMRSLARSIGGYDPQRGLFRRWLMAVVRRRLCDHRAERGRQVSGSGDTEVQRRLEEVVGDHDAEECWEQEYRRSRFQFVAERVRGEFAPSTWQAFWLTSVDGKTTREVAQALEISEGAVYIAKSRVLARIKKQIQLFED